MKDYVVYMLCDPQYGVVYVGSTRNIKSRLQNHKYEKLKDFSKVVYTILESKDAMLRTENHYISKYKPKYNKVCGNTGMMDVEPNLWYEYIFRGERDDIDEFNIREDYIDYVSKNSGIFLSCGSHVANMFGSNMGASFAEGKLMFTYGEDGLSYTELVEAIVDYYGLEDYETFSEKVFPTKDPLFVLPNDMLVPHSDYDNDFAMSVYEGGF